MGTTSSAIFTGTSQFSTDFQNVINRAVQIASLPILQMNNDVTHYQNQAAALTGIDGKFAALQTAVQGISDAMGGQSYQATVSNTSLVSAAVGDGVLEGNYTIEVRNVGAYATSMTTSTWNNQAGAPHTYQLWIGDKGNPANKINITPTDNSATSVAAAINNTAGDKVRATVVNVGSSGTPDYRISLQATSLGNNALDVVDGLTSLQTQQVVGAQAQYVVNDAKNPDNSPLVVSSNSRAVKITNGLTVNLLGASIGNPVNITVTRTTSALSDALSGFATAYNAVVDSLNAERGQTTAADGTTKAGALSGQSVVYDLSSALSGIATFNSPGNLVSGLNGLGLSLGSDGKLTFSPLSLLATSFSSSSGVTAFLGSATGGGFLKAATNALNTIEDPATGSIRMAEAGIQTQITTTNQTIADKQSQVNDLQTSLTAKMSAADAAIAAMEQQYSYIANMFTAMQNNSLQYK